MIARLRLLAVALLHEAIRAIRPMPPLTVQELDVLRQLAGQSLPGPLTYSEQKLVLLALQLRGLIRPMEWRGPTLTRAGRAVLGVP